MNSTTENRSNDSPLLPFDMKSEKGFLIPVEIKKSSFEGAGLGRFTKLPVKKGWVVRADPIVSVDSFLNEMGGVNPGMTVAIELTSKDEINQLDDAWSGNTKESTECDEKKDDGDFTKVQQMISWYIAAVPQSRSDPSRKSNLNYILSHSFITNYGGTKPGANNILTYVENGMLCHRATRDIAPGEELFLDYAVMDMSDFVKDWCKENNLVDVETLAAEVASQQ